MHIAKRLEAVAFLLSEPMRRLCFGAALALGLCGLVAACTQEQPITQTESIVFTGDGAAKGLTEELGAEYRAIAAANDGKVALDKASPALRAALEEVLDASTKFERGEPFAKEPPAWPPELQGLAFAKRFKRAAPELILSGAAFETPEGPRTQGELTGSYTLLAYWATWCAPCLQELGDLEDLAQGLDGQGLRIIAVQTEQRSADLDEKTRAALARAGVTALPLWRDGSEKGDAVLLQTGGTLPLTVLIGPDGAEMARISGLQIGLSGKSIWTGDKARAFVQQLEALSR